MSWGVAVFCILKYTKNTEKAVFNFGPPKSAQLLPLFCFVVCWHPHGHPFSRVYALLGGW